MRKSYSYIVNGKEFPQSLRMVNDHIRNMQEKPIVIKLEVWGNGRTSKREIKVKGRPGRFTIL